MGTRKSFAGAAVATTLNGAIAGGATSIVVTNGSSYPDGSGGPFVVAIDRGGAAEERILVASRSGNTLTATTRGYDGTAAQAHSNLAVIEHVLDVVTVDEANRSASLLTTKGDLYGRDATNVQRLAVGTNDQRLVADSTQGIGLRWAADTEMKLIDAKGDILAGTADNTRARLAVGANDTRLVADSTQTTGLRYAPNTENKLVDAKGDLLIGTADNTLARKAVGADGTVLTADTASTGGMKWGESPSTRHGCGVTKGTPQVFANGVSSVMSYDTEVWDTDGYFAPGDTVIVIPAGFGGLYLIVGQIFHPGISGRFYGQLLVNGAMRSIMADANDGVISSTSGLIVSFMFLLVPGDVISMFVLNSTGSSQNITANLNIARISV